MGRIHSYTTGDVTVTFDTARCIHAAECVRGLPDVFDTKRVPWVQRGQAEAARVKEVVLRCPTGALRFSQNGAEARREGPAQVRISADGPLLLTGPFHVRLAADGDTSQEDRLALCRCGATAKKPFCDGAHRACGFKDPGLVSAASGAGEDAAAPATLSLVPNGPLLIEGNVDLRDASGQSAGTLAKAALCRCGASANKPFCDGAHRLCGFIG